MDDDVTTSGCDDVTLTRGKWLCSIKDAKWVCREVCTILLKESPENAGEMMKFVFQNIFFKFSSDESQNHVQHLKYIRIFM